MCVKALQSTKIGLICGLLLLESGWVENLNRKFCSSSFPDLEVLLCMRLAMRVKAGSFEIANTAFACVGAGDDTSAELTEYKLIS